MSADTLALLLIISAAPPLTLFPLIYAWVARGVWWRNPAGRALMVSTTGLAALVDITLIYAAFGSDYPYRDAVRLTVYAWIASGAWLKFGALVYESRRGRRFAHRRGNHAEQ